MPYFFLEINNLASYFLEQEPIDLDPVIRWPWLDPFWNIVEDYIEGVQVREFSARSAAMVVKAEPDFLARWDVWGDIIKGHYPMGQMFVDRDGTIYHVTSAKLTELSGIVAHDLFAQPVPSRVDDFEAELLKRAEEFVLQEIQNELASLGHWVDSVDIYEAACRFVNEIDLLTADYRDIDACVDRALQFLATQYFQLEESK